MSTFYNTEIIKKTTKNLHIFNNGHLTVRLWTLFFFYILADYITFCIDGTESTDIY